MKIKRGNEAEFLRLFREETAPRAQKENGLRRLYLLRPTERNEEFVALSLWDSEKDAENYVNSGEYDRNVDRLDALLEGGPVLTTFKVEHHVVGKSVEPKTGRKVSR